jgi:hypothetical protein
MLNSASFLLLFLKYSSITILIKTGSGSTIICFHKVISEGALLYPIHK